MVLQNLSWQHFAVFVVAGSAIWYLVVYLLYFRRLPKAGGHGKYAGDADGVSDLDNGEHSHLSADPGLMGASREDDGVEHVGMHELEFSGPAAGQGPQENDWDEQPQAGSLEVITGKLKDSIGAYSEAGETSKGALLATLAEILRGHPELLESDLLESVLLLLCDYAEEAELPYAITPEELHAALED